VKCTNKRFTKRKRANPRKQVQTLSIPRGPTVETVYRFKRSIGFQMAVMSQAGFSTLNTVTNYGQGLGIAFSLNNVLFNGSVAGNFSTSVPNSSEFVALFDRYRIEGVDVRVIASQNVSNSVGVAVQMPICQIAKDYDDYTAPGSTNELLQRNDVTFHRFDKPFRASVRPKFTLVNSTATGTGPAVLGGDNFVDTTSDGQDCVWTGLKLWSESIATTNFQVVSCFMYFTVHYAFKTPR